MTEMKPSPTEKDRLFDRSLSAAKWHQIVIYCNGRKKMQCSNFTLQTLKK